MSDSLIIETSYSGNAAQFMLLQALNEMDTVNKHCINILDGIKKETSIPTLQISNIFQDRAAMPVSQGNINIQRMILAPQDYMVYFTYDPRDFENHYYAEELGEKLIDRELPSIAESFILYQLNALINQFNEGQIWRGNVLFAPQNGGLNPTSIGQIATDSQYQYFNGLINLLLNDGTTLLVPGATTITSSNILATMNTCLSYVPQALISRKGASGIKFLMSINTKLIYDQALTSNTFKDNFTTASAVEMYKGYEVKSLFGLPDNTIVVALATEDQDAAFWLGLNSKEDSTSVLMQRVVPASELFFIKLLFKACVNFSWADQVVLYTTIS